MKKFREYHLERLKNPEDAQEYLEAALELYEEDGDKEAFFTALRDVAESQGGLTKLAQRTHLNRQNLYRILSSKKNPRLETVASILHGLGFRLSIESLH
ncbi:MAG: putative addiction module antidote protein [Alphaproteobacteria bacterium 16-39-46]|nr:MAG: putative addiction module antidote protein [Alphaproteobacteria bacterium 16-39-46]OZA41502.1 MAG: putative addiction module antidote protein [Alphaproteobacteria bacterium 17-39-52]HQS84782.1 putative addiction module antidote protein [Alphaproteobacteria bacterium]HQS94464.1 putative addiction module antidote protein [Alphaproteobacteria bacterium]